MSVSSGAKRVSGLKDFVEGLCLKLGGRYMNEKLLIL
jgi:hypothetical protein